MLAKLRKITVRVSIRYAGLASIIAVCSALPITAFAIPFSGITQVYFFGDSLTDSGFNDNFPEPDAGKAPTFTTYGGYTWAQYLAHDIKGFTLPVYPGPSPADTITNNNFTPPIVSPFVSGTLDGVNYACGGSTTNGTGFDLTWAPSLHTQISQFLSTPPLHKDPNALYFIWSGANDFLVALTQPTPPTQLELLQVAQTAATNIANEVGRLAASGVRRVVVISLPNLGSTPFATGYGDPTLPGTLKTLSFTFDSMLNTALGNVIKRTGVKVLYVDSYTMLDDVVASVIQMRPYVAAGGVSFNFTNYTTPACGYSGGTAISAIVCPNTGNDSYVFADSVHPTSMTHRALSLNVEGLIQQWE